MIAKDELGSMESQRTGKEARKVVICNVGLVIDFKSSRLGLRIFKPGCATDEKKKKPTIQVYKCMSQGKDPMANPIPVLHTETLIWVLVRLDVIGSIWLREFTLPCRKCTTMV